MATHQSDSKAKSLPDQHIDTPCRDSRVSLIVIGAMCILLMIVFQDFIFLKKVYLFKETGSDSINGFYPYLIHLARYFRTEGMPAWSFYQGMGQNIFPFWCSDLFSVPLLLLKKESIVYGIVFKEILKIGLAGMFFYFYLRLFCYSWLTSIAGSLMYAFSGYLILGSCWAYMTTEAVYAALMLLATEKCIRHQRWLWFPIPIALYVTANPFMVYLYTVFFLFYLWARFIEWDRSGPAVAIRWAGRCCLYGVIGMGMSAVFLLPAVLQGFQSPRGSTEASLVEILSAVPVLSVGETLNNITAILRLFSSDIMGMDSRFTGWNNYFEAPVNYCGLLTLLMIPQAFVGAERRQKIAYGILILFCIIPTVFPFFRYSLWLYTAYYYRSLSLMTVIAMLFISLRALNRIDTQNRVNLPLLTTTLLILFAVLLFPHERLGIAVDKGIRDASLAFIGIYAVLLIGLRTELRRSFLKCLILVLIGVELGYSSWITVNRRDVVTAYELGQKTGYNDYTVEALAYINKIDKSPFFRINKTYSSGSSQNSSINDSMVQGFFGTPSYHSFNQLSYIRFLAEMKLVDLGYEVTSRWAMGLTNRPILQTIAGVKYCLTKRPEPYLKALGYQWIGNFGDVMVFRNDYSLPLGFAYDKLISLKEFRKLDLPQNNLVLLQAAIVAENPGADLQRLPMIHAEDAPVSFSRAGYKRGVSALKKDAFSIQSFAHNRIEGTIALDKKKLLFFSIPFDRGWRAYVDGAPVPLRQVNIGFLGIVLEKGSHHVQLLFDPPLVKTGLMISLVFLFFYIGLLVKAYRSEKKQPAA